MSNSELTFLCKAAGRMDAKNVGRPTLQNNPSRSVVPAFGASGRTPRVVRIGGYPTFGNLPYHPQCGRGRRPGARKGLLLGSLVAIPFLRSSRSRLRDSGDAPNAPRGCFAFKSTGPYRVKVTRVR
ncbi:unnamed protein product, partial [Iphiclides podalirius]